MKTVHIPRRFVAHSWGGTETVVLETVRNLNHQGHPSRVFTSMALSDQAEETLQGVEVRRFQHFYPYWGLKQGAQEQLDQKGGNLFSWELWWKLWQEPDLSLIHLHTGKRMGGIARWVAKRRRIPYVLSLHGGLTDVPSEERRSLIEPTAGSWEWGKLLGALVGSRRVVQDAGALLCLGRKEQAQLQETYPKVRVELFPNGVNVERFRRGDGSAFRHRLGIDPDACVLLCVARIDPQKNQLKALETLRHLVRQPEARGAWIHLVLAGAITDPEYLNTLKAYSKEHDLEGRWTYCGGLSGSMLVDAFHGSQLFFLPSRHEPFGIVILESWASGLPVVASGVGGVVDLIEQGKNGILLEPEQDAAVWAHEIALVLQNPQLLGQMRERALSEVGARYGWDHITRRLVTLYEEVRRAHTLR